MVEKKRLEEKKRNWRIVAGTTARTASALCGVNRKTAAYFYHRLREVIAYELEAESKAVFAGEVEVDESYFGGRC